MKNVITLNLIFGDISQSEMMEKIIEFLKEEYKMERVSTDSLIILEPSYLPQTFLLTKKEKVI